MARFPAPWAAEQVLRQYLVEGGKCPGTSYRNVPKLGLQQSPGHQRLSVLASFVEVFLAKEAALGGQIGINLLEKVQLATPAALYGAMLAGVDAVLVGAGVPARVPAVLDALSCHQALRLPIDVTGAGQDRRYLRFDPQELFGPMNGDLVRPPLLAIVSSAALATFLARSAETCPDGFVIEGPTAGGHNAPPRGPLQLDGTGQPVYGARDAVDLGHVKSVGLPFWLAGGYSHTGSLTCARSEGARGVQVGTLFALSRESAIAAPVREELLAALHNGSLVVRTDPFASPTGFPFKVAQLPGTLSDPEIYQRRRRVCDLGYLREPYLKVDGSVGYRCPAEPVGTYVHKGGNRADTQGRLCLCNALTSVIGLGQLVRERPGKRLSANNAAHHTEPPVVTMGEDLGAARELLARYPRGWMARDVLDYLGWPERGPGMELGPVER